MNTLLESFERFGWFKLTLGRKSADIVKEGQEVLLSSLRMLINKSLDRLEDYHKVDVTTYSHIEIHKELSSIMVSKRIARRIAESEIELIQSLVGPDLHIMKYPLLRMARPGIAKDNVGFHRDTYYGAPPLEIGLYIPFTTNDAAGCFSVFDGSCVMPDRELQYTTVKQDVKRGSMEHEIGFLYERKVPPPMAYANMHPVLIKPGEIVVFMAATIHGQEVNNSPQSRFSTDIHIANSFTKEKWGNTFHEDYYERFSMSPAHVLAKQFEDSQ